MSVFQQKVLRDAKRQEKVHAEKTKGILELDSDITEMLELSQGIKKNRKPKICGTISKGATYAQLEY